MLLILISGHPGSGKTTISKKIAEHFQLPLFGRDTLKELMFDHLGWKDREWSNKLGKSMYPLLYHISEELLQNKVSHILESNFTPKYDSEYFQELQQKYNCTIINVCIDCNPQVAYKRIQNRVKSQERHPGHCDERFVEGAYEERDMFDPAFSFGCSVIRVDATDWDKVDYDQLFGEIIGI